MTNLWLSSENQNLFGQWVGGNKFLPSENIKENRKTPGSIPFFSFLLGFIIGREKNQQRIGNDNKKRKVMGEITKNRNGYYITVCDKESLAILGIGNPFIWSIVGRTFLLRLEYGVVVSGRTAVCVIVCFFYSTLISPRFNLRVQLSIRLFT